MAQETNMWGFESHFLAGARLAAEAVFGELAPTLSPQVFLLGVQIANSTETPGVSIYPTNAGFTPSMFGEVNAKAELIRGLHLERPLHLTDDTSARRAHRLSQIDALTKSITVVIEANPASSARLTYCSRLRVVDEHLVTVVLQLNRAAYNSLPHLQRNVVEDIYGVPVSLVQTAATKFIEECVDQLSIHSPGAGGRMWPDTDEMIRAAGIHFMAVAEAAGRNWHGLYTLYRACNAIASQKYEGEDKVGSLLVAKHDHPDVEVCLTFTDPVSVRERRGARKLLQMCSETLSLLADGVTIYGLGRVRGTYDPAKEDVFEIRFTKHSTWRLLHSGMPLMEVSYGEPRLPRPLFEPERFRKVLAGAIAGMDSAAVDRICERAREASQQRHGTMLVITPVAAAQAARLRKQSTVITPTELTSDTLRPVTEIDGAVLLDDHGVCHAVGVILDGTASENGTPSRGARYNSAIRFADGVGAPCVIVIISEDGTVDFYPS